MTPKMIWANLASSNLERTSNFYTQLGFKSNGSSDQLTSFFFADNNFIIHFFLTAQFESAVKSKAANLEQQNEIIFSLSAQSKDEVDAWVDKVKQAGGKVFSDPENIGKGYSFGFADPDGHKFNVLYWPGM